MVLPVSITGGTTTGHNAHHIALHGRFNFGDSFQVINVKDPVYGAVGDGVANDTAAIAAAYAACPAGGTLYFPNGFYVTDAIVIAKCIHILGDGRWTSWLKPRTAITTPLVKFNLAAPGATVRNVYGPSMTGMGIDNTSAVAATGIEVSVNTGWFVGYDLFIEGGAVGINNIGTNSRFERFRIINTSKFVHIDGDTGGECTLREGDCTAYTVACTVGIEMVCASGGANKGDLRIDNVALNTTNSGGGTLDLGLLMSCPSLTSMPLFANQLVVDNAKKGLKFLNIADVRVADSWINAAAGTTSAVEIAGGYNHKYSGNTYFGGSGGGGSTYEFTGGTACAGFQSSDNKCPTGPVYRITGSRPTDHTLDDICPGATAPAQVTNDVPFLSVNAARRWGQHRIQGEISRRESGTYPWAGYAGPFPGGTPNYVVVTNPNVTAGSRVKLSRERFGGTAGHLACSVADHVVGTSFTVFSNSATDTGYVYWEMYDPD